MFHPYFAEVKKIMDKKKKILVFGFVVFLVVVGVGLTVALNGTVKHKGFGKAWWKATSRGFVFGRGGFARPPQCMVGNKSSQTLVDLGLPENATREQVREAL